jgi:hypothetical protein
MIKLCAPAIIYVIFSMIQIVIDTFKGLYNTAFMKSIVMIFVTFLLNLLCEGGLTIVSWIIVFVPFILMTVIVTMLLYIFGLNATTGQSNYSCKKYPDNITVDANNNIIIYDPDYNYLKNPAYYKKPNIFIPNTNANTNTNTSIYNSQGQTQVPTPSFYSSDPSYQS